MATRRAVLGAGVGLIGGMAAVSEAKAATASPADLLSEAEATSYFDVDRTVANLDAAYFGAMPRSVHQAYVNRLARVNAYNSAFLRDALPGVRRGELLDRVRAEVGSLIGAQSDEIALSTGGTDALYALIVNYRPLQPGDQVIMADVDYDEMQFAIVFLKARRGVEVVKIALPEPPTAANVLAAYDAALRAAPRAKLLLLTHLSNRHGLVPPVKAIIAMAKARGVEVILDSAQAVGQLPFTVDDLGADFVGFSLHKWVAAPLGTGAIYIRKSRLADIEPWLGDHIYPDDDVQARLPTGTADFAARLAIPEAVAFHRDLGPERKLARLRSLRKAWIDAVRGMRGVEIVSTSEPESYGAVAAFRLAGVRGVDATKTAQQRLLHMHGVLVVAKPGLAAGPVLRVTPALFTTQAEIDRLVAAIGAEAQNAGD
jgi:selenocysteine lyase/cysteine desulfurase